MPDSNSKETWLEEFRRINQESSSPSTAPKNSSPLDRRRQHPRFELDEARANLFEGGLLAAIGIGRENLARMPLDLSEGGLRVLVHRRIKVGTKVKIHLEIDKHRDAVQATGVVRWCFESASRPGDFYAGVMFTNLSASQKRKITLMRDWFTSPQFRALRAARRRNTDTSSVLSFPR